jgi:hypothetical protein
VGIAAAGADTIPHSATPATRLIARAFIGISIWLLHLTRDKCRSWPQRVLPSTSCEQLRASVGRARARQSSTPAIPTIQIEIEEDFPQFFWPFSRLGDSFSAHHKMFRIVLAKE